MFKGRLGQFISLICIFLYLFSAGQLSDDFSDGDFSSDPAWGGDADLFTVDNGLLRSNSPGAANYFLSTPNEFIDDTQWEFWINLDFATSGANYVDIFIVSDNSDLSDVQDGYFIRFGETEDEISFYKVLSGSESILIDGPDGELGSSNNIYRVRVTRTSGGAWTLELDEDDTGVFAQAGTVTDTDVATTGHFGIRIEQSSAASVVNNHFFDDFVIAPVPVDEDPPELIQAQALAADQVRLTFSEALDESSVGQVANYSIDGGIGNPISAELEAESVSEVILTLFSSLANGESYTVSVSGVADLAGNIAVGEEAPFTFFIPEEPVAGDVIFNELFPDPNPSVGLPEFEFIELYNRSEAFFDLEGWILVNTTTERPLSSAVLPPEEFLILCDEEAVAAFQPFGNVMGITSFTALANGGDSLTLRSPGGEVLDIVVYTDDWYGSSEFDDGGYTLERINPTLTCSGEFNWTASQDDSGGTPGSQNSVFDDSPDLSAPAVFGFEVPDPQTILLNFTEPVDENSLSSVVIILDQGVEISSFELTATDQIQIELNTPLQSGVTYTLEISGVADCEGNVLSTPQTVSILIGEMPVSGDLMISEIMADPNPAVGLPEAEYFELFNASDKTLELAGCEISEVAIDFSLLMAPGEYLAFASEDNANLFEDLEGIVFLDMSTSFLTNGGRELILLSPIGEELDFVEYSEDWYGDPDKDDGGYSLELINPFVACSGAFNWTASNSSQGGTPNEENSVFSNAPDVIPPGVERFEIIDGTQIDITFTEPLDAEILSELEVSLTPDIPIIGIATPRDDRILIEWSSPFETGESYQLQLVNVKDCEGNIADPILIDILLGVAPAQNEVLITEIMADPSPSQGLPEAEYIELYNASDKAIDLMGCDLSGVEIPESIVFQPGEYLFFASLSSGADFLLYPEIILLEGMSSTFLTNGGRELVLTNPDGLRVDRVNYDLSWYGDADKEDGGYSLERINLNEPCRGKDNWTGSNDEQGGTPGQSNSVFSEEPDLSPPEAIAVYALSEDVLEIRFNEVLDSVSVVLADVQISPSIELAGVINRAPDYSSVLVLLSENLQEGLIYELSITEIADCVGNFNVEPTLFTFALPQPGEPGDILINEVLFDPRTGGRDFVELYNASDKNIGLRNWVIQNADLTTRVITEDPLVIFPGQHLVLTDDIQNIIAEYPMSGAYLENFFEVEALPSFNNGEGSVILADSLENVVDRFDYLEDYHFPLLNSFDGVSLERLSYTRPTNEPGNWSSASERVGFSTAGYINSQFLPEGRASAQFELEDEVFSPDNDGFEDVLLINYLLDDPGYLATIGIYDRRGRLIRRLANNLLPGTEGTISWDGTTEDRSKARIGPHIILIELFTPEGRTETFKLPCVVAGNLSN